MRKTIRWSANLAYAVGLITTDGSLSKDGRHIVLVSKDIDQLTAFAKILKLKNKISQHTSFYNPKGNYFHIQFGNVSLYNFLVKIGLTPNKSKTIGALKIPDKYFADFLRGHLDGDGYTNSYFDRRWKNSFMFYTGFVSASKKHLEWLDIQISRLYKVEGKISFHASVFNLRFAKNASIKLLNQVYYKQGLVCLQRKQFKIKRALDIISKHAGVLKLVDSQD